MLGHLNKLYTVDIQRKVSSMIIFKRCSSLESSIICHFDVKGTNPLKKIGDGYVITATVWHVTP